MKQCVLFTLMCFLSIISLNAQNKVTGVVQDGKSVPLISATVVILNPVDSVMAGFGITNNDGKFEIDDVNPGEYDLQITYVGFGTVQNRIQVVAEEKVKDVGIIVMTDDATLMDAVEVKGRFIPIVVKKDTIEYNADAYRVKPNASVEDLLKKMPGIEVDGEGNITAQGEEVQKVTVDGKKFFGNDPKAATKNLPADAIKKVQVYDDKSKAAKFSGVDDGNETKTINLELKEDRKKGYFGNIAAGYGTSDRIDSKINLNSFNKKLQLSGIGSFNNINQTGFSFGDYQTLLGGNAGFGRGFNSAINLNFGNRANGDTENTSAGLNMNYEFSKKAKVNASYFLVNTDANVLASTQQTNFAGQRSSIIEEDAITGNNSLRHVVSTTLELELDSIQRLDLTLGFDVSDANSNGFQDSEVNNLSNVFQRQNITDQFNETNNLKFEGELDYNLRLGKKGRVLSFEADYGKTEIEDSLDIFQELIDENLIRQVQLNQFQLDTSTNDNLKLVLEYKEPLGNDQYLDLSYSRSNYSSYRLRDFISQDDFVRDYALAQATDNNTDFNDYEVRYTLDKEKFNLRVGLNYHQSIIGSDAFRFSEATDLLVRDEGLTVGDRTFAAFLPSLSIRTLDRALRFSYDTRLREPSISNLQTIVDNTNPNFVRLGNANLRPEYSHDVRLRYNKFDRFTLRSIFSSLSYNYTQDNIINAIQVGDDLVTTSQPINGNGAHRVQAWARAGTPFKKLFFKTAVSINGSVSWQENFVNNIKDNVQTWNPGFRVELENLNNEFFTLVLFSRTNYNNNFFEINEANNSRFLTQGYGGDLIIEFGKGFVFDTEIDYSQNFQEGELFNEFALWNASISKSFLEDKLTLKLTAFDLLDQNTGVDINQSALSIQRNLSNTLERYFMLKASYKISGFGAKPSGDRIFIKHS